MKRWLFCVGLLLSLCGVLGLGAPAVPGQELHSCVFTWDQEHGLRNIRTNIAPNAINDNGQVVGHLVVTKGCPPLTSCPTHAFIWDPKNGVRDLGTLGGKWSQAYAVNNAGQVIGRSPNASGQE